VLSAGIVLVQSTLHSVRSPESLALISARERELAQAAGRPMGGRPRYADEPAREDKVMRFHKKKPSGDAS
jgi:hypothetical protein